MKNTGFIARRYLFSRKHISLISTLTYISITGVTVGTALLIVVLSVFNGFFTVIKGLLLSYDPDIRIEQSEGRAFVFENALKEQLDGVPEIRSYFPHLEGKALLSTREGINRVVDVRGVDEVKFSDMVDMENSITEGVFDLEVRGRTPGAVLPDQIRSELALSKNEDISLMSASGLQKVLTQITVPRSSRFDIRGVYFLQQVAGAPSVFIDLRAAQRLFDERGKISGIDIKLQDHEEAESLKMVLQEKLGPDWRISTWYDLQKPLYDVMYLEKWGAYVILMIIVVVAVLNILGSLTMIVIQKKRDIGILISMGFTPSMIRMVFRKQGLYIGLIGCILGGILGLILCWLQAEFGLIQLSSAFIINAYPVDVKILDVILIVAGSLILCVAASWLPSNRAARIQPADAIRYE